MADEGLQLEDGGRSRSAVSLDEVNDALARFGTRVWPLDLTHVTGEQRRLLDRVQLTDAEVTSLRDAFLLSRARLLELITGAGREPRVANGGDLATVDVTHDVHYPELYPVAPGIDYSRFDRLHVNRAEDGSGVDETLQMLAGRGVRVVQSLPDVGVLTLFLDCPSPDQGWTVSYSGAQPHIASFTDASAGSKILMQIIGPARWNMEYVDT
jgi:hypothetical protein